MPSRPSFLNNIETEQHIKGFSDRELMEFTARQVCDIFTVVQDHGKRIKAIEHKGSKLIGIAGGIGTAIGAIITGAFNYLRSSSS